MKKLLMISLLIILSVVLLGNKKIEIDQKDELKINLVNQTLRDDFIFNKPGYTSNDYTTWPASKNESSHWTRDGDYMYFNALPTYAEWKSLEKSYDSWNRYIVSPDNTYLQYYNLHENRYENADTFIIGNPYAGGTPDKEYEVDTGKENIIMVRFGTTVSSDFYSVFRGTYGDNGWRTYDGFPKRIYNAPNPDETKSKLIRYYDPEEIDIPGDGDGEGETPEDIYTTVDKLPGTSSNRLGTVKYKVEGVNLIVQINYSSKTYYLKYRFTEEQDMSIFKTIESYYININKTPQLIINHSDRPYLRDILEAPDNEKPAFVPHSIWDLNSNEIDTQLTYKAHIHLKQNDKGVMMAYMYIDEFVIDRMISANLQWTERQETEWWVIGSPSKGPWTTYNKTLVAEEYTKYRNLTSTWEQYIPVWNIIRGIYNLSKVYEMPQIAQVNLNDIQSDYNITKPEIENYFRKKNSDFDSIKSDSRYKLWAFALGEGKDGYGVKTVFYPDNNPNDPRSFKIINLNYITNGKAYVAVGDDMDLIITINPPDLPKDDNPDNPPFSRQIIFIAIVVFSAVILISSKAYKSPKKFFGTLILIALSIGIVYFGYQYYVKGETLALLKLLLKGV